MAVEDFLDLYARCRNHSLLALYTGVVVKMSVLSSHGRVSAQM